MQNKVALQHCNGSQQPDRYRDDRSFDIALWRLRDDEPHAVPLHLLDANHDGGIVPSQLQATQWLGALHQYPYQGPQVRFF